VFLKNLLIKGNMMTEKINFVYEWEYGEDTGTYLCVGQVFILGVQYTEEYGGYWSMCWDNEPSDPRWGEQQLEISSEAIHPTIDQAMDWCEEMDMKEADYDAAQFEQ
jgi:hypothetical protein